MLKIAMPILRNNICTHFGKASHFLLFEINNKIITDIDQIETPPHEHNLLPEWLANSGVTHIIASGIGQEALLHFHKIKINVIVGIIEKFPMEVVIKFLTGKLAGEHNNCERSSFETINDI